MRDEPKTLQDRHAAAVDEREVRAASKTKVNKASKTKERRDVKQPRRKRQPAPKPSINIIGAGRLGTALALAFAARGYTISALVARHTRHAQRASQLVRTHAASNSTTPLALNDKQLDKLPASDIIIITTPDDAIAATAARLAAFPQTSESAPTGEPQTKGRNQRRGARQSRTVLHASGALSSDVLNAMRAAGYRTGSMHPLLAISDSLRGAENLRAAFFCVEGERAAVRVAHALVYSLGAQSFSIKTDDKALYHAAAVMASGHMVALFDMASKMLAACGLKEPRARAVLLPLVRSTLENLAQREPARVLTGTFARADITTARRHLAALHTLGAHEILAAYTLLGQRSLQLAGRNGVDADALKEIDRLLRNG